MPIRRRNASAALERQLAAALITNRAFLGALAPQLDPLLFQARPLQRVAGWCKDHFLKYDDAPGKGIETAYNAWVEREQPDEQEADAMGDFLSGLSATHAAAPVINVPYLLDEAAQYLTLRKLDKLRDALGAAVGAGDPKGGMASVAEFASIQTGLQRATKPLNNKADWEEPFADPPEGLLEMDGHAKRFFSNTLTRDSLVGIQGPEKRGKTFWCLEFAYRALAARRKVAFFQVGDMSKSQIMRRIAVRVAGIPMWAGQCKRGVSMPAKLEIIKGKDGKFKAQVEGRLTTFPAPVDRRIAWRAMKQFNRRHALPRDKEYFMVDVYPNSSVSVRDIDLVLSRWRNEAGFTPDVIIIDYADILAPETVRRESRDQVNDTWKALRRLSQEWHALVLAPTQSNAASYKAKTLSMANFSEDKRKFAHVTGMLGLNQTTDEKRIGVMRLNWVVLRESDYSQDRCLYVTQCLALGKALVQSAFETPQPS